jgi:hypothetical protein
MKVAFAAGILATVFMTACGQTVPRDFDGGANGTWAWNGWTWTKLSANSQGLNLRYWKDFGGLISIDSSTNWGATRWNGSDWVPDDAFPGPPPHGSDIAFGIPIPVLDEANDQLLSIDQGVRTIWAWSHGTWAVVLSPTQWPNVSRMSGFVYDPYRKELVSLAWKDPQEQDAEIWAWDGRALRQLSPVTFPLSQWDFRQLVPDDAGHMLALGRNKGFSWDGKEWSRLGSGFCPTSSVDLGQVDMAYDIVHKELIAIGTGSDGRVRTWDWEQAGWIPLSPASAPSGGLSSLAYDPELPGLVLTTFPIGDCCWFSCGPF